MAGAGPTVPVRAAPTLNTLTDIGRLFKVLSVEVFNLRCISTAVVQMQPIVNKRTSIQNTLQTSVPAELLAPLRGIILIGGAVLACSLLAYYLATAGTRPLLHRLTS